MKLTYLMNSYVFLEVYSKIEKNKIKTCEIRLNPIVKYLKEEAREQVYENIRNFSAEIEKVNLEYNIDETLNNKIFKSISVTQVNEYPIESFNVNISENIVVPLNVLEVIKASAFLCCSNIALIVYKNSEDILSVTENIIKNTRLFTLKKDKSDVIDIMIRDSEETADDLILSININEDIFKEQENFDTSLIASEVIGILEELKDYLNKDVIPLLVEDECIIRISRNEENVISFDYNKEIIKNIPDGKNALIQSKCNILYNIILNY